MISLAQGTVENLLVDVEDRAGSLLTLDSTAPKFSVRKRFETVWLLHEEDATHDGLRAFCLIDTTDWEIGEYELYIDFNNLPEIPRLGPMFFEVAHETTVGVSDREIEWEDL